MNLTSIPSAYATLEASQNRFGAPYYPRFAQICKLTGSTLIPLPALPQRLGELDRGREMVVHCKSGMRSQKAIQFLRQQGFTKLMNLKGGILAWADRIDPSMPKY